VNSSSSSPSPLSTLRLGARGSLLSRLQSGLVAQALEARHPGLKVELTIVATSGDVIQDRPLHEFGGKGLFTKELEQALLRGEVDFAVHSFKDVPVTMPLVDVSELTMAAVPAREDPRDTLVSPHARTVVDLPKNARVGTSSLRRQAQVLALRSDLRVLPIRGNIDTRIRKLKAGEFDAVILAMAGLRRAGLFDPGLMNPISTGEISPAAGQGALALQCRAGDGRVRDLLEPLNDPNTALAVELEREVVRLLNGDCHSPIAALATFTEREGTLEAVVAARDGRPPLLRACATGPIEDAWRRPNRVVHDLQIQGAAALLGTES
jgi:hydroxymethylbilane synthase